MNRILSEGRPGTPAAAPPRSVLGATIASEWLKLRTLRSGWYAMGSVIAVSIAFSVYYGFNIRIASIQGRNDFATDIGAGPEMGVVLTQWGVVALAIIAVCGEYASGSIRTTLHWVPRRTTVLLAKTVVTAGAAFVAGVVAAVLGAAAAWPAYGGHGVFSWPDLVRSVVTIAVVLAGIGAIAVGIAAAVRSAAGTLGVALLVLLLLPLLMDVSGVQAIEDAIELMPFAAARNLMNDDGAYPAPVAVAIIAAWAAVAFAIGDAVLRRRDA